MSGCSKLPYSRVDDALKAASTLGVPLEKVTPYWCWKHQAWHWSRKPLNAPFEPRERCRA